MLRIRPKLGSTMGSKEWTCCFGLHVRTTTIIIGVWHLVLNLLALGILSIIIRTNNFHLLLDDFKSNDNEENETFAPILPTPLSKVDPPYAYRDHFQQAGLHSNDVDMSGLVFLCMIGVTLMLIYGAVKGKPSHLLPFFCLQIFDFAIATLTAAGHLCYIRSMHLWISESQNRLPWREELIKLNPQTLSVLVLIGFILFIFMKAYAIGVVWRCYKFLTFRQQNLRSTLPYTIPVTVNATNVSQERDNNLLLPDYEEAITQSLKQAPPPSYVVAMSMNNKTAAEPGPVETVAPETTDVNQEDTISNSDPPPYNDLDNSAEPSDGNNVSIIIVDPEVPTTSLNENTGKSL